MTSGMVHIKLFTRHRLALLRTTIQCERLADNVRIVLVTCCERKKVQVKAGKTAFSTYTLFSSSMTKFIFSVFFDHTTIMLRCLRGGGLLFPFWSYHGMGYCGGAYYRH